MPVSEMADITRVSKASPKLPTLRTSIPIDLAKGLEIGEGDSLVWTELVSNGKKGLFVRKVE